MGVKSVRVTYLQVLILPLLQPRTVDAPGGAGTPSSRSAVQRSPALSLEFAGVNVLLKVRLTFPAL